MFYRSTVNVLLDKVFDKLSQTHQALETNQVSIRQCYLPVKQVELDWCSRKGTTEREFTTSNSKPILKKKSTTKCKRKGELQSF